MGLEASAVPQLESPSWRPKNKNIAFLSKKSPDPYSVNPDPKHPILNYYLALDAGGPKYQSEVKPVGISRQSGSCNLVGLRDPRGGEAAQGSAGGPGHRSQRLDGSDWSPETRGARAAAW